MSILDVFVRIQRALDEAKVPYMVTGSFASSVHGEPRASKDIDIVIAPTREKLTSLVRQFSSDRYYAEEAEAFEAMAHKSMFNVIDFESGWRIDFIIRKDRPFSVEEFNRRRVVEVSGLKLYVAAPEDILVAKLEWAKMGESARQIEDAASIVRAQGNRLDVPYIERWVRELQLREQWEQAKSKAV